jgi:hypothetical protein
MNTSFPTQYKAHYRGHNCKTEYFSDNISMIYDSSQNKYDKLNENLKSKNKEDPYVCSCMHSKSSAQDRSMYSAW